MAKAIDLAIIGALRDLGRATARQIEAHPDVVRACQRAHIKARGRLDSLMRAGRVQSDMAYQGAVFWVSVMPPVAA